MQYSIPVSLYIHIPWCLQKCPYCDFHSQVTLSIPEKEYLKKIIEDLHQDLALIENREILSIFIGGGTPTVLSENFFDQLLNEISKHSLKSSAEITCEANPGTFNLEKIKALHQIGINRLSLGIQSFQDKFLKILGRIHDANVAKKAIDFARTAGFDNLNLDLMFGLPNQSVNDAMDDLKTMLSFNPEHISWYQLTIEPNTPFAQQKINLPDEETTWPMQKAGEKILKDYDHYEISNYSLPKFQCQHNLNYWQFGDYLGIGAGAHGKITQKNITRIEKTKDLKKYLNGDFIDKKYFVPQKDILLEFMMNALRLTDGVPATLIPYHTQSIDLACERGLITLDNHRLKSTELGRRYLNECLQLFMED